MALGGGIDFNPGKLGPAFDFRHSLNSAFDNVELLAGSNPDRVAIGIIEINGMAGDTIAPYKINATNEGWPLVTLASQSQIFYYREWGPVVGYEWFRDTGFTGEILVWQVIYRPNLLLPIPESERENVL